jgi:hypothetical protein
MLPRGLSDQDAVARAKTQALKRRGPIDGLEVWDSARLVASHMAPSADEAATLARLAAIPATSNGLGGSFPLGPRDLAARI